MIFKTYKTKEEVFNVANSILNKSFKESIDLEDLLVIEKDRREKGYRGRGYFGQLVERYIFGLENNSRAEPDFPEAGVELKTNPIKKHPTKGYVSKERLVFSKINYTDIIEKKENWEDSSFLKKNKLLLLIFYLYEKDKDLLDYEFKFANLLDILGDISVQDIEQIKKDWEFIVSKIRRHEAHLLSEGDTYYLGACTKGRDGSVVNDYSGSVIAAKPRAFSLKQTYLNYLIQKNILSKKDGAISVYTHDDKKTIEEVFYQKFSNYIGKTDVEIMKMLGWNPSKKPKNFKRLLANRILIGSNSNNIEELKKANITLKALTLESTGTLKESISFPAFNYNDLITQIWYDGETGEMADFHAQLETKKFLFIVFQKIKNSNDIFLKKIKFWNFPMQDIKEAEIVFDKTLLCINEGRYEDLPKIKDSLVSHVRPHGKNGKDKIKTPQNTMEMKRCFWLNAKYIQKFLNDN